MGLTILGIGCFLIVLGIKYDNNIPLLITGSFVTLFMGFFLGYTMPSSLLYYYEKAVIKKYGSYTKAIVIDKKTEDCSYTNTIGGRTEIVKEYHYYFTYKFTYKTEFTNSFYVKSQLCFDKIEIGSEIPIKFLKSKPLQSEPRRQKLCKDLGLDIEACS